MENFNKVSLAGYITKQPLQIFPPEGSNYAVECEILIERPESSKPSRVTVVATDANALVLQSARKDDYILVPNARIVTTNYRRTEQAQCLSCHRLHDYTFASEKTEVIADGKIEVMRTRHKSSMGMNRVTLMGNITSDTKSNFYQTKNGHDSLQIKIAVDRPSWKNKDNKQTADFPYLLLFGRSAKFVHDYMKKGDLALIEGYVTERKIFMKKSPVCPHCGSTSETNIENVVREIIVDQVIQFPKSYQIADLNQLEEKHETFKRDSVEYNDTVYDNNFSNDNDDIDDFFEGEDEYWDDF